MKNLPYILLISLFISLTGNAQISKFISVSGRDIIGSDGKPFLMKGTNLGNWLIPEGYMFKFKGINSPKLINQAITELIGPEEAKAFWANYLNAYVTEADIHYLKSTGMNSIRIPFSYKLFTYEDYLGENNPDRGFELIDKVIGWCKKENLYVILDMHAAPGGQTGDNIDDGYGYPFLFDSPACQKQTADIWLRIANHYKNEPIVMGYDLLNEPIAHYFKVADINTKLEPLYKTITKAIRTVDKNHLIFLGGSQWDSSFKIFGTPFDSKLVYQFHKYWTATTPDVIKEYVDFREKYNVPIYCGETGENKDIWVQQFKDLLAANNIGWHYWPYKKMDNTAGIINFKKPEGYDQISDYTEKPRTTFADIRKAAPDNRAALKAILYQMISNSKFENCTPNTGYIQALGLKK